MRALQRFQSLRPERSPCGHYFYADDDVAIRFDCLLDFRFIDQSRIGKDAVAGTGDAAKGREIDIIQHARPGVIRHVVAKDIEQRMASAAGVDNRGDARAHAENVRVNTKRAKAFHKVQMNVDQSGCNDVVFDVDHKGAFGGEINAYGFDGAAAHANIEHTVPAGSGIDDATGFKNKMTQLRVHCSGSIDRVRERAWKPR